MVVDCSRLLGQRNWNSVIQACDSKSWLWIVHSGDWSLRLVLRLLAVHASKEEDLTQFSTFWRRFWQQMNCWYWQQ